MAPRPKAMNSNGKANFSNTWMRLCPNNAMVICVTAMMSRHRTFGTCVNVLSASAPETLLTANQPMPAVTDCRPAGRMLPQNPNATRDCTICGTPYRGPRADSTAWKTDPTTVPSTSEATAFQKLSPKTATDSTPTNTVANSKFGDIQVQNSMVGRPCRSSSGMNSAPPGSIVATASPYWPSRISSACRSVSVTDIDRSLPRSVVPPR